MTLLATQPLNNIDPLSWNVLKTYDRRSKTDISYVTAKNKISGSTYGFVLNTVQFCPYFIIVIPVLG